MFQLFETFGFNVSNLQRPYQGPKSTTLKPKVLKNYKRLKPKKAFLTPRRIELRFLERKSSVLPLDDRVKPLVLRLSRQYVVCKRYCYSHYVYNIIVR